MRLRPLALMLSAATFGSACGRGSPANVRTASRVAGDYVMMERNGHPLPNRMDGAEAGCHTELVRDVLTLRADGSAGEEIEGRGWCDGHPRPDTNGVFRGAGSFELRGARGDSIVITMGDAGARETMSGAIAGDELRVTGVSEGTTQRRSYRYVRQR